MNELTIFPDHYEALRKERLRHAYEVCARICIKYGGAKENLSQDNITSFWEIDDKVPSAITLRVAISVPKLKWFIHNNINVEDGVWNADFVHGLTKNLNVRWNSRRFPSVRWANNKYLSTVIADSKFGGPLTETMTGIYPYYTWIGVAALYMKHSEQSIEYLAGLLAAGKPVEHKGIHYAQYSSRIQAEISGLGIPIEPPFSKRYCLISPIWPALLSIRMPTKAKKCWGRNFKCPNAEDYAASLWYTYIGKEFKTNGIPFLKSRRTIYYRHKNEKNIEKLRLAKSLILLDNRIGKVVQEWGKT